MRLAFVNQRYGLEVNGGSEYYTRLMAEHLAKLEGMEVHVITTKAKDYTTWTNDYKKDTEEINGVVVHRFPTEHPRNKYRFYLAEKLRSSNLGPTKFIEKNWINEQGPYTPKLINYIKENKDNYDVFIFVTYLYYPAVFGLPEVADKAVFIPTAHDEPYIHMDIMKKLFKSPRAFVYLTEEEKEMVNRFFSNETIPSDVIGVGIDRNEQISAEKVDSFREKYGINGEYLIYAGRIDEAKGCAEMFEFFRKDKENHPDLKLVALGKAAMEVPEDENIITTGFVSDEEKDAAIKGAKALILPSKFESLSIAVLEAMADGVPVIVNGACPVLKGHIRRSNGGYYYNDFKMYQDAVNALWTTEYEEKKKNAVLYVENNYKWQVILNKFCSLLKNIA